MDLSASSSSFRLPDRVIAPLPVKVKAFSPPSSYHNIGPPVTPGPSPPCTSSPTLSYCSAEPHQRPPAPQPQDTWTLRHQSNTAVSSPVVNIRDVGEAHKLDFLIHPHVDKCASSEKVPKRKAEWLLHDIDINKKKQRLGEPNVSGGACGSQNVSLCLDATALR